MTQSDYEHEEYQLKDCKWAVLIANKTMKCNGFVCPLNGCPDDLIETAVTQITCGLAQIIIDQQKGRK
jgi:hypothetical protein